MSLLKVLRLQNGVFFSIGDLTPLYEKAVRYISSEVVSKCTDSKFKKSTRNNLDILENEVLYGRSVCNIALKASRRPIFRLHLLRLWEDSEPTDARVVEVIALAKERRLPTSYLTRSQLNSLSLHRPHQGVCLVVGELPYYTMDQATCKATLERHSQNPRLWVLLCGILDPMNMGAIMRTCLYFAVDKVVVTGNCAPLTPIVSKASSGAAEILQAFHTNEPISIIQALIDQGWEIIGTVTGSQETGHQAVEDISKFTCDKPALLLIGSEGSGLPCELVQLCTKVVTISSQITAEEDESQVSLRKLVGSLNVSTATAIVLHGLRQSRSS